MQITTKTQGFELNTAIDAFVRNRLHVALKRLSASVVAIDVFAKDTNGPKGGVDKLVLIRVQLPNRQVLAVETSHENLYAAIEKGATVAGHFDKVLGGIDAGLLDERCAIDFSQLDDDHGRQCNGGGDPESAQPQPAPRRARRLRQRLPGTP